MSLQASPFHIRTSELNRGNDWCSRNGVTLPAVYDDVQAEALAARTSVILSDVSHWSRVLISGDDARKLADQLFTNEASSLWPQHGVRTLWLSDTGGVRGIGSIARYSADAFILISEVSDLSWFQRAAAQFDASVRDYAQGSGGLSLVGPYAAAVLKEIGFPVDIARGAFHRFDWRGVQVALSHHGAGYEIWASVDDALIVWDRLMAAGQSFGMKPAGVEALDILNLERGDFSSLPFAREPFAATPSVSDYGLGLLVDNEHLAFNGRNAFNATGEAKATLVGLLLEGDIALPKIALRHNGKSVGSTHASLYSPALRRPIALASVERTAAALGTVLDANGVRATVGALPFLPL